MRTFRKAVSVTFSSVLVFGKVPFNAVSANGLDTLKPQKSKKAIANINEDVAHVTGLKGAEGVFASFGTKEDFVYTDVAGKVAVVTRGLISVGEQIKNAIAAGAVALVMLLAYSLCQAKETGMNERAKGEESDSLLPLAVPVIGEEIADTQTRAASHSTPQPNEISPKLELRRNASFLKNRRASALIKRIRSSGRSHDSPRTDMQLSALSFST
ncbi:PA domain-containing protein [Brevibacillus fluminis]|uniref:PA domain-containing protein n=1 Tax=Brevibacillus fluminis TaxID=511487 RepID=UPI003F8C3A65